jgi:hypothetical protein
MTEQVTMGDRQLNARANDNCHSQILNAYDLLKVGTPLIFKAASCKELETSGVLPVLSFDDPTNGTLQFPSKETAQAGDLKAKANDTNYVLAKNNDAPVKNNDAPMKTNDAPVKTNDAPVKTNDAPVKNNDAPVKTNDAQTTSRDAGHDSPKDKLEHDIDNIKTPGRADRMHNAIKEFELRAKADHLTQAEIDKFYSNLDTLIATKDGKVSQDKRAILAEQCLEHAAHPHDIDQGRYNTCNVTTLEERSFTKNPSKMAEILSSVALTGSWNGIKIDERSLEPRYAAIECPPKDGVRTFASQVINVTLVNDITQRRNPPMYYSEEVNLYDPKDGGERLRFANGKEVTYKDLGIAHDNPNDPVRKPCVNIGEIQAEGTKLSGDSGFCIANVSDKDPHAKNVVHIHSKEDLIKEIKRLKAEHKLPAVLMVDGADPMFNNGRKSDNVEAHVVSIVDYDDKKGVSISNQWGHASDKWFSIDKVYAATILTKKPHEHKEHPKHS